MKSKLFFSIFLSIISLFLILSGCVELKDETDKNNIKFEFSKKYRVKVVNVIDGDTIDVEFKNGSIGRIRFLGIDTPETNKMDNNKYEYRNVTNLSCLAFWGLKAKNYTKNTLLSKEIFIEFDENAGFKGGYGRWLSYVYLINGTDFNKFLLKEGYARVYSSESFLKKKVYLFVEFQAFNESLRLWSCKLT